MNIGIVSPEYPRDTSLVNHQFAALHRELFLREILQHVNVTPFFG